MKLQTSVNGNTYIPLFIGYDAKHYLGQFGKICVAMFLFLSGYGLYKGAQNSNSIAKYTFSKIVSFYKVYWRYFIVFIPFGFIYFKNVTFFGKEELRYTADYIVILKNLIGISSSFNGEWWFVKLYIGILILIFPLYSYLVDKKILLFIIITILMYSLSLKIHNLNEILFWQLSFLTGMLISKYENKCKYILANIFSLNFYYTIICLCICILIRFRFQGQTFDFILAPIFIFLSINLMKFIKMLELSAYIGKYSFPMWLNHSFFCYYYFQDYVFLPKYSPIVLLLLLMLSLSSAIVVENFRETLISFFIKKNE